MPINRSTLSTAGRIILADKPQGWRYTPKEYANPSEFEFKEAKNNDIPPGYGLWAVAENDSQRTLPGGIIPQNGDVFYMKSFKTPPSQHDLVSVLGKNFPEETRAEQIEKREVSQSKRPLPTTKQQRLKSAEHEFAIAYYYNEPSTVIHARNKVSHGISTFVQSLLSDSSRSAEKIEHTKRLLRGFIETPRFTRYLKPEEQQRIQSTPLSDEEIKQIFVETLKPNGSTHDKFLPDHLKAAQYYLYQIGAYDHQEPDANSEKTTKQGLSRYSRLAPTGFSDRALSYDINARITLKNEQKPPSTDVSGIFTAVEMQDPRVAQVITNSPTVPDRRRGTDGYHRLTKAPPVKRPKKDEKIAKDEKTAENAPKHSKVTYKLANSPHLASSNANISWSAWDNAIAANAQKLSPQEHQAYMLGMAVFHHVHGMHSMSDDMATSPHYKSLLNLPMLQRLQQSGWKTQEGKELHSSFAEQMPVKNPRQDTSRQCPMMPCGQG